MHLHLALVHDVDVESVVVVVDRGGAKAVRPLQVGPLRLPWRFSQSGSGSLEAELTWLASIFTTVPSVPESGSG